MNCERCGVAERLRWTGRTSRGETVDGEGMGLCLECYRGWARATTFIQTCDACGKVGAFRNVSTRVNRYLCDDCHITETGYSPQKQLMDVIARTAPRVSMPLHSQKLVCALADHGTACAGEVKPRSALQGREICTKHANPKKFRE